MRKISGQKCGIVFEASRKDLLVIKDVLYESYVEVNEWELYRRIRVEPKTLLALLKEVNLIIKSKLKVI